ncbi:MAG: redox-sensing transcriptional repressor Rex [Atribacterota bacterium]|nr:redox-sensing transcriptional repressor Rex [Atribacterota bacterium]
MVIKIKKKQKKTNVPQATINRLSIYHRSLELLIEAEEGNIAENISSSELAKITGITSSQIRKDLSYFGEFGKRGIGYPVLKLIGVLRDILIANKKWDVIMVGAGNIGKAFLRYKGFQKRGFTIKAAFDIDKDKIGKTIDSTKVIHIQHMENFIKENRIKIGIITVPSECAQDVAEKMIAGGIKSILNFAPVSIRHPKNVRVNHIDIAIELEKLVYYLKK